jgi:hypothetical protein
MTDGIIIGSLTLNSALLLAIVFGAGKYVQRVSTLENRVETIEEVKAEVSLASLSADVRHLSGLVATIQDELHAIAKILAKSHTGLSTQTAGD